MSPPGRHSLRIIIEDDEGFTAEDTVSYFIEIGSVPTGQYAIALFTRYSFISHFHTHEPCLCCTLSTMLLCTTVPGQVPPLTVHFINDSPRVMNNSVEADIVLSRPVQSLVCNVRSTSVDISMDCEFRKQNSVTVCAYFYNHCCTSVGSSGRAQFFDLQPGRYALRVVATNQVPDKELIRRGFSISDDPNLCTLHLINNGVTVVDNNVTVEFAGTGPARGHKCQLDREDYYECMLLCYECMLLYNTCVNYHCQHREPVLNYCSVQVKCMHMLYTDFITASHLQAAAQ